MSNAQDQIAAKQAYLRKNIPEQKYEDFGEFCEATAGSIDIENWSIDYVQQLVQKFKRSEADKAKNNKKTGAFHLYQTGSDDQLKEVSNKLKKEREKKQQIVETKPVEQKNEQKIKSPDNGKTKQEKSALDVLDSIFNNPPAVQQQKKKYDKAFFESCNFWGVPTDEPTPLEKNTTTPPKIKQNQANKFATTNFVIQPDSFQKMFQTGLGLPEQKQQLPKEKQKTPIREVKVFEQIPIQDQVISKIDEPTIPQPVVIKGNSQNSKKPQIKLVSVKDIKSPKSSKLPYDGQVLLKQSFKTTVACFKSFERAALSSKDLKVEIVDHEIINRSFFSSDYPMFHLKVLPANIICKRNMEDFQKLRRNLEFVYPGVRLPFLQKGGWLQSETSPQYIQRQKKYLSYFLDDILQNNQLKNSRLLQDFLTLRDHKQMKRKFEEYDRIKRITSIEELCLLEGQVKIQFSQPTRQYNQLLQTFLAKLKTFWMEEQRILTQVAQMQASLADSYRQLRALIDGMASQTRDFNRKVRFNETEQLEVSFRSLGEYVSESMKVSQKETEFLKDQVLVYLKYQLENMNMLTPVIDTRNDLTRAYLRRKDSERANDKEQYLSERLQQSKTGILQESSNITVLKYQCGYINALLAAEGHRYFTLLSNKMEEMISNICYAKLDYLSKTINTFTALVQA